MSSTRPANHSHQLHGPPPANGYGGSGNGGGNLLAQKSHVVAGVRDAYWSDEEEQEEPECPLCVGAMDMDDLNFKPCPCGYQICRFCYHHIKENLNGRCPACRREYSDDNVEWKAMSPDDQKRLHQQKKQKEKEKKELEILKRGHLPNMRVVQRNVVYVTGLGPRYAKEELIPSLRSHDYFGQYGKITKILLVKRNATASRDATAGVYITYNRREDAARAIAGVDGSPSPGGGGEVMRASYGTTKYCMSFLRNLSCSNPGCMELHEWGDEKDSFTKEDLATLKHALKDSESRQKFVVAKEADTLPRAASWGMKGAYGATSPKPATMAAIPTQTRAPRTRTRPATTSSQVGRAAAPPSDSGRPARTADRERDRERDRDRDRDRERRGHVHSSSSGSAGAAPASSSSMARAKSPQSSSRPVTPLSLSLPPRPSTATDTSTPITSPVAISPPLSTFSPIPPTPDVSSSSVPRQLLVDQQDSATGASGTPPPPSVTPAPPPQPIQASYQLSTQAQALLDDVRARRQSTIKSMQSPFPDLDRALAALNDNDFSFSFNLDPKLVPKSSTSAAASTPTATAPAPQRMQSPAFKMQFDPFGGVASSSFSQASQALPPPPGLARSSAANAPLTVPFPSTERTSARSPNSAARSPYLGSFDPFSDVGRTAASSSPAHGLDDETSRRASRFGFAQKKVSPDASSSRFSGSAGPSPRGGAELLPQTPLYASSDVVSPAPSSSQQMPQWTYPSSQEYGVPHGLSPLQYQVNALRGPQQSSSFSPMGSFSPFGPSNTESALKDMLNIGRNQAMGRQDHLAQAYGQQPFGDPAIMAMRMSDVQNGDLRYQQQASLRQVQMMDPSHFGGPPGLINVPPPGLQRQAAGNKMANGHAHPNVNGQQHLSDPVPSPKSPTSPRIRLSASTAASMSVISPPPETPVIVSNSPAFSPSDFPELLSTTVDRPRPQQQSKKSESKPARKPSLNQAVSAPASATVSPSTSRPLVKKASILSQPTQPTPAAPAKAEPPPTSTFSSPSTTTSHLKGETEMDFGAPLSATSSNGSRALLVMPTAPPISRKLKRIQARTQAKEKAPSTTTPTASTPASRVPSPPTVQSSQATPASPVIALPLPSVIEQPMLPVEGPHPLTSETSLDIVTFELPGAEEPAPQVPESITPSSFEPQVHSEPAAIDSPVVPDTPSEAAAPGLSKKARKILAAKAAAEAAEAKAQELQKARSSESQPEILPYADLMSAGELMSELKESLDVETTVFLDMQVTTHKWQAPLPYAPLVDALSVLSVGNAPFVDGIPSSSSAISSFQQLLETLTQAISDLLRLLPRITWTDNSAFDSAILDILKAEDFMTDGMDEPVEPDGDVAALTLALERRAKWMKVQLAKLEELHRDINKAAVRAIFALNDRGWDVGGFLPKSGGNLERVETLGSVQDGSGQWRPMTMEELDDALAEAKLNEGDVEVELRRVMMANIEDADI